MRLTGEPGLTAFALPDDTLAVGSPEATRAWVEKIDRLREPGFTIAELDYILAHRFGPSFKLPLGDAEIGLVLRDLQTELRKLRPVAVGEAPPTQQQFEEIAEWLAGNLPRLVEDAEEALRIVRLTSALSQADQDAFVTEHLSGFVDAEVLAGLTAEAERLVHVYRGLVAFLSRTMTIQRLAAASGLEAAVCEALVGTYPEHSAGGHAARDRDISGGQLCRRSRRDWRPGIDACRLRGHAAVGKAWLGIKPPRHRRSGHRFCLRARPSTWVV